MKWYTLFICVVILLLGSCSSASITRTNGTSSIKSIVSSYKWIGTDSSLVSGTILSSRTGEPVSEAIITISSSRKILDITNECGQFEFRIKNGKYKFLVTSIGYGDQTTKTMRLKPQTITYLVVELGTSIIYD